MDKKQRMEDIAKYIEKYYVPETMIFMSMMLRSKDFSVGQDGHAFWSSLENKKIISKKF